MHTYTRIYTHSYFLTNPCTLPHTHTPPHPHPHSFTRTHTSHLQTSQPGSLSHHNVEPRGLYCMPTSLRAVRQPTVSRRRWTFPAHWSSAPVSPSQELITSPSQTRPLGRGVCVCWSLEHPAMHIFGWSSATALIVDGYKGQYPTAHFA